MRLQDAVTAAVCAMGLAAGCAGNRDEVRREPIAVKTQTETSQPMKVTVTERKTSTSSAPLSSATSTRTESSSNIHGKEAVARSTGPTQTLLHDLEQVGTLREDPRGTLLVFKSSDLFAVNGNELLPDGKRRLDTVAASLKDSSLKDSSKDRIRIEAFTDGVAGEGDNLKLTQERATEVRDYLAKRGVDKERMDAVGITAEGRRENRRVEILLPWRSSNLGVGGSGQSHFE
ncbi:MAG: OmpA family protein [Myxococcaceae bacterium]